MKTAQTQFTLVIISIIALAFMMGYTRPAAEEPKPYLIVYANGHEKMEKEVEQKLSEGWRCQGGVVPTGQSYVQALVK